MDEAWIEIPVGGGLAEALLVTPPKTPAPGVLLLTDIMGLREVFVEQARRLAGRGYVVLVPNIFHRERRLPLMDHTPSMGDADDRAVLFDWAGRLDGDVQAADGAAFVDALTARPEVEARIGVVGYCLTGGMMVQVLAARPVCRAGVSFHGGWLATDAPYSPHRRVGEVHGRMYFGHAADDHTCPPDMIARFEAALDAAGTDYARDVYPAGHGFTVADQPSFDPVAAERCWQALERLFATTLTA